MDVVERYSPYLLKLSLVMTLLSYIFTARKSLLQSPPIPKQKGCAEPVDVLIIGGGPAGLSAATTLYRHQHDIRIFDHGQPRNSWDTATHALLGWEGEKPSKLGEKSRKKLEKTGLVDFISAEVKIIERKADGLFRVTSSDGVEWMGRKLLLAMGGQIEHLDIPGYGANYPERIFHCLFTFGFEHRGSSSAGILAVGFAGNPFHTNILVDDARKFTEKVTIYTNGDEELAQRIRKDVSHDETLYDARKIKSFTKLEKSILINFDDGESKEEAFLVHQPGTRVSPSFVQQLGLELNERGDIVTKMPFHQTSAEGVFAAGDCASPFKIISNAVFMGANAGAGIARELPTRVTGNVIDRLA